MKHKPFLIIALCAGLQTTINFASENQGWYDYLRSKWTQFTQSHANIQHAAKTLTIAPIAYITQKIGPTIIAGTSQQLGIGSLTLSPWHYSFGTIPTLFIWLVATIGAVKLYKHLDANSKTTIKDALRTVINNPILYPTRSSKIHALLKKDEFLHYIHDAYGLIQEVCNELIAEISARDYPEEQKVADEKIDTQMANIRNKLTDCKTLDDQIRTLEKTPEMQAYFSLYFRLKNKQAVETKLAETTKK